MSDESVRFLVPKEGVMVRDPDTLTPLSESGEWKTFIGPSGRYWRRRVNCGDVEVKDPLAQEVEPEKAEETFYKRR